MPIALSLSSHADTLWAAGPEGLYRQTSATLEPVMQPQAELSCCLAGDDFLLVGGLPHGVAYSLDEGANWRAGWMEGGAANVLCLAAAPDAEHSGMLLAGSAEDGVWRSRDSGRTWRTTNVGLEEFAIFCLAWAPPAPPKRWPAWDVVFAGAEHGLYRSPNGGRAWKKCAGISSVVQCVAVASDFHHTGITLAGTEADGLWRATDGGRVFAPVSTAPSQINALTALADGWLLSDDEVLWHSHDGESWRSLPDTPPAFTLLATADGVWAGGFEGLHSVDVPAK